MTDEFKTEIEEFEKSLIPKEKKIRKNQSYSEKNTKTKNKTWSKPSVLFCFDPNTVSGENLNKLGFSKKQIRTLNNYRKKGGVFFTKEDLLKIYGIQKDQYIILEPYIKIEEKINVIKSENIIIEKKLVEINTATKEELIKLKGIGAAYAERIIKYRNKLGGFYKKDQLLEVYGMDSLRYSGLCNDAVVDTCEIRKININNADYKTLISHPYLNKYQTESILKYKELLGSFSGIEQIYQNKLLNKEEFFKLKPYLEL